MSGALSPVGFGGAIAANLATAILQHHARRLERTKVGKSLKVAGLLRPDLDDRLHEALTHAIAGFGHAHPEYALTGAVRFFELPLTARQIGSYLLDGKPLDKDLLIETLADCLDIPNTTHRKAWPNGIDPEQFLDRFLTIVSAQLLSYSDPAILLIRSELVALTASVLSNTEQLLSIHDDLPSLFDAALVAQQSAAFTSFETTFLQHLRHRCERLTTPGARELHGLKQSLSVAYISLNIKTHSGADPLRAEDLVTEYPFILIRGPAGSGKTTLVHWITLQCAAGREHKNRWTGGVPFVVPLRTVARIEAGPPRVEHLVRYSVDEHIWSANTPPGWIETVLRQRRAIMMIDGVDELPPPRRPAFWDWLNEFVSAYPGNRIVVTSRTLPASADADVGAKTDQWNPPAAFVDAELEPMSIIDIREFIFHWHDAVDKSRLDDFDKGDLERARRQLPDKLEDPANRRIRELCGTPLLCVVVCVLNWREEGYLSRRRVELYGRCCDMLIEERDLKRGVAKPQGSLGHLTKNDKELALQRIAFQMMHSRPDGDEVRGTSYRIEIPRNKAIQWIERVIPSFQTPLARECNPKEVLDYLVERTGLLREPTSDLIDFPHRSFQEYLAACAAGAEGQEDLLAKQADDDQWHETIMLAAGTPTGGVHFGRSLVEALLNRGERHTSPRPASQRRRKTCFALALGCLDNMRQHDQVLRDRVLAHLEDLVPPHTNDDAKILAVAGDAVLPNLHYCAWKDRDTSTVAACAEALVQIGSAAAMQILAGEYAADQREAVIARVCRAPNVDLAQVPLIAAHVEAQGALPPYVELHDLGRASTLNGLKSLMLSPEVSDGLDDLQAFQKLDTVSCVRMKMSDLETLRFPSSVRCIAAFGCDGDRIEWITRLPGVHTVALHHCHTLADLSPLRRLVNLETLTVEHLRTPLDFNQFYDHGMLANVAVAQCRLLNLKSLATLPLRRLSLVSSGLDTADRDLFASLCFSALRELRLWSFDHATELLAQATLPEIESLTLADITTRSVSFFERLKSLKMISIINAPRLTDVSGLASAFGRSGTLRLLELVECPKVDTIEPLAEVNTLRLLALVNVGVAVIGKSVSNLTDLEELRMVGLRRLRSCEELAALSRLKALVIADCPHVSDLEFVKDLNALTHLSIRNAVLLRDIRPLAHLSSLEELDLSGCGNVKDLGPLSGLPCLKNVLLSAEYRKEIRVPEAIRTVVSYVREGGRVMHRFGWAPLYRPVMLYERAYASERWYYVFGGPRPSDWPDGFQPVSDAFMPFESRAARRLGDRPWLGS